MKEIKMKVIDLFAGCGGLSLGFIQNGFEVTKAVEFDAEIAKTYSKNHPQTDMIVDDIGNIDNDRYFSEGEADIVIGGCPCQGFSTAGARIRKGFVEDPRNYLFKHFLNIVKTVKPKMFIMENVKGMMTMQNGEIFEEILTALSDKEIMDGEQYHVYYKILKGVDLGIPQKRERLFIVGIKDRDIDFESLLAATEQRIIKNNNKFFDKVSIKDAIANMPTVSVSGIVDSPDATTPYEKYLAASTPVITNHIKTKHSEKAVERMRQIGNGENFTSLNEKIKSVHSGAYGRLCWDEAAPTITTRFDTPAGGRFIHPNEDRTLTPREAARIQSFPDDFVFVGNKTSICKQIGNAVPPKMSFYWANFAQIALGQSVNYERTATEEVNETCGVG